MIASNYLKKKKIKHEFSLLCGENELNYSHIVIRIFLRNYIFFRPNIDFVQPK